MGNFLTSWKPVSFSRGTLLYRVSKQMQACVSFKSQYCAFYAVEATVSLILIQIMKP